MFCTSHPRPRANCFHFVEARKSWKTPTNSTHQDFILGYLLTRTMRS